MAHLTVIFLPFIFKVLSELTFFPLWRREKPLYKLDVNWPLIPFTGQTFCVAVDDVNGLVYVGQVGKDSLLTSRVVQCVASIVSSSCFYSNQTRNSCTEHWAEAHPSMSENFTFLFIFFLAECMWTCKEADMLSSVEESFVRSRHSHDFFSSVGELFPY